MKSPTVEELQKTINETERVLRRMKTRISLNQDGSLDEVVIPNCTFHLEQMSNGHWWIGIYRKGKPDQHINLSTKRGTKITARIQEQ